MMVQMVQMVHGTDGTPGTNGTDGTDGRDSTKDSAGALLHHRFQSAPIPRPGGQIDLSGSTFDHLTAALLNDSQEGKNTN